MRLQDVLIALLLFLAVEARAAERPARVLLPDVVAQDERSREAASLLSSVFLGELIRSGREVLGAAALKEKGLAPAVFAGCPNDACREAGVALGADYLLLATAARLGKQVGVELKLVEPASGRLVAERAVVVPSDTGLAPAAQAALTELLREVPVRLVVAPAPAVVTAPPAPAPLEVPPPAVTPAPVAAPPVVVEQPVERPSAVPAAVVLGAGAAAAAGGVALLVSALQYNREKTTLTMDRAVAARASAEVQLIAGYGLLGAGVVAAGIGTAMLVSRAGGPAVGAVVTPDGAAVTLSGRF